MPGSVQPGWEQAAGGRALLKAVGGGEDWLSRHKEWVIGHTDSCFCLHRLDNLLNMAYGVKR